MANRKKYFHTTSRDKKPGLWDESPTGTWKRYKMNGTETEPRTPGGKGGREVSRRQNPGPARPRQNGGARLVPVQNVYTYGGSRKAKILEWRRLKKCPKKNPNKKRILMIRQELTRKTSPQCLEWRRRPNSSWKRSMEQIFHQTIWRRVEHDEAKMRRTFLGSRRPQ